MRNEIKNHQRQKEKQNGSPFISFTTTTHDIFGSTGKNFEDPWGKATVDLAKIKKDRIYDTHSPVAYKEITGVDEPNPEMPFEDNEDVAKNATARDSLRTRELVVLGNEDIPNDAVVGYRRMEEPNPGDTPVPRKYEKDGENFKPKSI